MLDLGQKYTAHQSKGQRAKEAQRLRLVRRMQDARRANGGGTG